MAPPIDANPGSLQERDTQTIGALLRGRAIAYPKRLAVIDPGEAIDYRTLDERTDRLAAALAAASIGRGDRVATMLVNSLATFELYFAVAKLAAIIVPLNWRWAAPELHHGLSFSGAKLVFVSERLSDLAHSANANVPIVVVPEEPSGCHGALSSFVGEATASHPLWPVHAGDPWLMLFTSGTTGRPKACLHRNLTQTVTAASNAVHLGLSSADRLLLTMPMFHVSGLGVALAHLAVGGAVVVAPRDATPSALRDLITHHGCTVAALAGLVADEIAAMQTADPRQLPLRLLLRGGGQQSLEQCRRIEATLGCSITLSYGQTESGGQSLFMRADEQTAGPRAVGRPALHLEARIADDLGANVPDGSVGELQLRGASIMIGYWNDPVATNAAITDGWLRTGDRFFRDADGYLHFAGRAKELIKSGGENVYPMEVEQILLTHPDIVDCAVVGVPDLRWREAVKAFVVSQKCLTPAEVSIWCSGKIAGYKRPRYVEFVDQIPRNFLNKIDRLALAERAVDRDQRVSQDSDS